MGYFYRVRSITLSLCLPPSGGDILFLAMPSVCLSVCPSVRVFLSGLHLQNRWPDFDETSQRCSLSSLVVHIVCAFRSDDLLRSYGPFIYLSNGILSGLNLLNPWPDYDETSLQCLTTKTVRICTFHYPTFSHI